MTTQLQESAGKELKTMSFGEHLEELRSRILRSLAVVTIGVVVALVFQRDLLSVMSRPHREAMGRLAARQETSEIRRELVAVRELLEIVPREVAAGLAVSSRDRAARTLLYEERLTRVRESLSPDLGDLALMLEELLATTGLMERQLDAYREVGERTNDLESLVVESRDRLADSASENLDQVLAELGKIRGFYADWESGPAPAVGTSDPESGAFQRSARSLANAEDQLQRLLRARQPTAPLRVLKYTDSFFAHLKVSLLAGLALGLPWMTLEMWWFISAGLYARERRAIFPFLPLSLTFLVLGGLFAYYVLTPVGLTYLGGYGSSEIVETMFTLNDYLSLVITLILGMSVLFQLPLLMVFLSRAGLVQVASFRRYRRYSVLGALVVGAMLTPPDIVTQALMAGPLILLYEAGVWSSEFFARKKSREPSE